MMLEHSFGREDLARNIIDAVDRTLADGFRTKDLCATSETPVGTQEFGDRVIMRMGLQQDSREP